MGAKREDLSRPFVETSRDGFLLAQELSVYSLVALTRAARPLMPEGGSIVTLSYHGSQKMMPSYNVMGVAKAALESAVRYLARTWAAGHPRERDQRGTGAHALGGGRWRVPQPVQGVPPGDAAAAAHLDRGRGGGGGVPGERRGANISGQVLYVDGGFNTLGMAMPPDEDEG